MFEVAGVNRINSAEYHRVNFLKTWQRIARGTTLVGDSVTDFYIGSGFDVRDEVTDVPVGFLPEQSTAFVQIPVDSRYAGLGHIDFLTARISRRPRLVC